MAKIKLILRTAPVIFIVLTSAFLGVVFLAPDGGSSATNDDTRGITGNEGIGTSDTFITKNWQAVETLESWWNSAWDYRKKITITEPNMMAREREPVDIYLTFTGNEARVNSIRLTLFNGSSNAWYEVPSQVWNATTHSNGTANFYDSCSVTFLLNMTKADSEVYYVYYDPVVSTPPSYTKRIAARGRNNPAIDDDTVNPSFTHSNGTAYNNVDSIEIATDGNWAAPRAAVCLVDTMRQGSDWGGPACSIYSARQGATDVFNLAQQTWMSIGEMALQASDTPTDESFSQVERCNVGPDNPFEAWDGLGAITILDDGPLFVRFRIQTTDGAYTALVAAGSTTDWHRDSIHGTTSDSVTRGTSGSLGYVKYNITYTFFFYGTQTFVKIDLDILSAPQRGPSGSGYPVMRTNYPRVTSAYFKNFGDWPHLGQLVRASTGAVSQDQKAWLGSKYSPDGTTVYNMPIGDRRRDFPTEPWTAWYHSTNAAPSIGMFAITNSIGWEVTSLAVAGIGPNSLLQQILPEGHQGDMFNLTKGTTLRYDYYLLTSAAGTNWSAARDMCRRMNDPVSIVVSDRESFNNNAMFIHVNDRTGTNATGVRVIVNNSADTVTLNSTWVDANGNTTHLRFPDGTYRVHVEMFTPNTGFRYIVNSETIVLDHTVPSQRIVYREYNTNMANLTIDLRNALRNNEALVGAQIRVLNATTNATIEQVYTTGTPQRFRLYSGSPNTPYRIQVFYGGIQRVANVSDPYLLAGNVVLRIGVAVDTAAITIQLKDPAIDIGDAYHIWFSYHQSNDPSVKYTPTEVFISDFPGAPDWSGSDYSWSVDGQNNVSVTILTGTPHPISSPGNNQIYIRARNNLVEEAVINTEVIVKAYKMNATFTVNGYTGAQLNTVKFPLGSTLTFNVQLVAWNGTILTGATVTVYHYNATNPAQAAIVHTATPVGNNYTTTISLDLNTFYAINQPFYIQAEVTYFTGILEPIVLRIDPIGLDVVAISGGVVGGDTISAEINSNVNFRIIMNASGYSALFLSMVNSIEVRVNVPYIQQEIVMTPVGGGEFRAEFKAPDFPQKTPVRVTLYVPTNLSSIQLQYNIQLSYTFYVDAISPTGGGIEPWVFWLVFAGLIVVVVWFVAYQVRFKYPPMIRKIMDLKRSVGRDKVATRIPTQKVRSREEGIYHKYASMVNAYSFLQTRDTRYASKAAGYAPVPDDSISLDFELKAIDQPDMELPAAPVPKGMMKKAAPTSYAEPPVPVPGAAHGIPRPTTKPAPLSLETPKISPAQPGVIQVTRPITPSAAPPPAMPKPMAPAPGAPPSIKALPKPAAGMPRPSVPAPKPAALSSVQDQVKPENLYQELVLLEQKRYKAERSLRDLDAKHARGTITDAEYNDYQKKIQESLDKLKENIANLRRKMLSF
ncbi:MAG: hypothetical protein JW839_02720 [Candidatus Lokiarchaeota archaeon]|nr:hypothetical protein [Candidatus Lokiarchaeota archaeon]